VLIASRQAMRARPAFGAVAAVVAWVGFTSLFASVAIATTWPRLESCSSLATRLCGGRYRLED
jgi:hypothetical protein